MEEFFALVNNANIGGHGKEYWIWTLNSPCTFKVKSTYLALHNLKVGSNEKEVFKWLWQIKISNKVSFMI